MLRKSSAHILGESIILDLIRLQNTEFSEASYKNKRKYKRKENSMPPIPEL